MELIKKVQTKNYIAELLKKEIFLGNIKDGEKLTQELIAKKLGVSRMPVREALQLLEQEGFVRRLPNRHMCANGVSYKNIVDNFRILSSLETEIAKMILEEDKDIMGIKEAARELEISQSHEIYVEKTVIFHKQLSIQLENSYIQNLHDRIITGYFAFALKHLSYHGKDSTKKLRPILKALETKDKKDLRSKFDEYFKVITDTMKKEEPSE